MARMCRARALPVLTYTKPDDFLIYEDQESKSTWTVLAVVKSSSKATRVWGASWTHQGTEYTLSLLGDCKITS